MHICYWKLFTAIIDVHIVIMSQKNKTKKKIKYLQSLHCIKCNWLVEANNREVVIVV